MCTEEICQEDCYKNRECPSADSMLNCLENCSHKVGDLVLKYYNQCTSTMDVEGSSTPPCTDTDEETKLECCTDKANDVARAEKNVCSDNCRSKCRDECATICTGFCDS